MIKPWQILSSKLDADYKVFKIRADKAVSPRTNRTGEFYTIQSNDWVNVVPLTGDREVVMIRQYRHGSRKVTLEIPGGLVDEADPGEAAARELLEETGYAGRSVSLLGSTNPNPAIFDNTCYTYLVEHAEKVKEMSLDVYEDIEVELVPITSIPQLLRDGTINHALVIVAFHFFFQKNGYPEGPCFGT
ncbi:MAG: NUDIX hydrolase [Syntrophorhabdales bacterium]|jgi:8-oxo-dGTP pyrophosphatase MutT (NUDIX family)